jgi:hypothetical protein
LTDYDRCNPVSEREAKFAHLGEMLKAGRLSEEEVKEEIKETSSISEAEANLPLVMQKSTRNSGNQDVIENKI